MKNAEKLVVENICAVLNNYLKTDCYKNVIFCWVLHKQEIWDGLLSRLDLSLCRVKKVAIVCSLQELSDRIDNDVSSGKRSVNISEKAKSYVRSYYDLKDVEIVASDGLTPEQTADMILKTYL